MALIARFAQVARVAQVAEVAPSEHASPSWKASDLVRLRVGDVEWATVETVN